MIRFVVVFSTFLLAAGLLTGATPIGSTAGKTAADCPPNPWITNVEDPRVAGLPKWPAVFLLRGAMTEYEWPVCIPDNSGYDFIGCPPEVEALATSLRNEDPNLACRLEIAVRTGEGKDAFTPLELRAARIRFEHLPTMTPNVRPKRPSRTP